MKRITLLISAAFLLLAGCTKEQLVEERSYAGSANVVKATFESLTGDSATKAAVTDAGTFNWQNGDQAAFAVSNVSESYVKGTNSSTSATAQFELEQLVSFSNSSWAIYPFDLTTDQTPTTLKVKVPASRVWAQDQTNVAMYGIKETSSNDFNFFHMGGLVRIEVNNVPTNARKFVFKTSGYKINGEFTPVDESNNKVIKTVASNTESEQTYTLTWNTAPSSTNKTVFYVPLPVGEYTNGFAFYLKDGEENILYSKVGTTSQPVARKQLLLMPAINLVGGTIEPAEKAAVVQEVPAGHSGDFLLAKSEKVVLKVNASAVDKDITLKYNDVNLPTNLKIEVVGEGFFNAKISGDLPYTHVDFTEGEIKEVDIITSGSTFNIIHPAKISDKLTVRGGNVVLEGAKVGAIEVAANATANPTTGEGTVKITMNTSQEIKPEVVGTIVAKANIEVAPAQGVEVFVAPATGVNVTSPQGSQGEVITVGDKPVMIGTTGYDDLAAAINVVTEGQTIKVLKDISNANGISVAKDAKNFTVDFGGHTYTCFDNPAGSTNTANQVFQLNAGNTIIFKNGTINVAETNNTKFKFIIQNYADLTLEDMILDGTNLAKDDYRYTLSNNAGNINLTGKTSIKAAAEKGTAFDIYYWPEGGYSTAPVLTWNSTGDVEGRIELAGATFIVEKDLKVTTPIRAIKNANRQAKLTVKAGATIYPSKKFSGNVQTAFANSNNEYESFNEYAGGVVIVNRGANLLINGNGKISTTSNEEWCYSAVCLTEKGESKSASTDADRAKLTVEGNVTLEGYYYGVVGNGSRYDTDITINGGTIKGIKANDCTGIYHPQKGNLTISGGTIEGATGIYVKSGDVQASVTAGTIKGVGTNCKTYNPAREGDGCDPTGDALVIDNCGYPGGAPTVEIKGGTFISDHYKAVASYAKTGYPIVTGFIKGGTFSDESAIKYAATNAAINIVLNSNRNASGIFIKADENKTITFDLGGNTLNFVEPAVGSTGTENQAFHIEKGNGTFTLKNGKVTIDQSAKDKFRFIIQNYNNLVVEDVKLDGANLAFPNKVRYTVSNNSGTVEFKGNTTINAASEKDVAFDAWDDPSYDGVPQVTVNTTGNITGQVEVTGGTLVVTNGTFNTTGARRTQTANHQSPTLLISSGTVTVNGGSFTSAHDVAVRAEGGTVTLNHGIFTAPEGAVCFPGAGATINIAGGTYNASDNAVIIGQGSAKDGNANTVNISGGTFNGGITSSGYIACGIYAPWKDNITVTAGTFNITKGSGVVVRGGKLTMSGATFKYDGDTSASGWVGDNKNELPCGKDVVIDKKAAYPEVGTINVTATGYNVETIEAK